VKPHTAEAGAVIRDFVKVEVLDGNNHVVTGDNTDSVTIALGPNPGNAKLRGTKTVTVNNGVATFDDLSIRAAGLGYVLVASGSGFTTVASTPFDITPAARRS
jgi:hypothetical protein